MLRKFFSLNQLPKKIFFTSIILPFEFFFPDQFKKFELGRTWSNGRTGQTSRPLDTYKNK